MTRRKMKDSGVAWIGQVPEGWRCSRMKYEVSVRDESRKYDPHADKYIGLENLISYGTAVYETESAYPEAIYACCRKDDVLFSKLRPYLAKCVLSPLNGFCTGEFVVFKEFAGDKRFLRYWLLSDAVLSQINASTYGAKMPRASEKFILNMPFLSPPLAEQRKIAAFLDGECGKIDVLRGKVEKQIAALEEYRKSVITEAVTKGVRRGRKMKPSGVEWIGEVPEDWQMSRLKNHAVITTGNLDTQDANPDGDYPFYVRSPIVERADTYTFEGPGILMAGDGAGAGRIFHLATGKYAVHQRVYRLFRFKDVDAKFLWRYLSVIFPKIMDMGSAQSTVPSVRMPMLSNLRMFVPHLPEQREIAAYLDRRCATIDSMVAKCREELDRLAEYKKSLIYEYVTGKKEVA